jgi:hypothetical protein
MDTRYQPEGLSFDSNNLNPNFNNGDRSQYPPQTGQQQDQYPFQSGQQQRYSPPPTKEPALYGTQSAARLGSPQQQRHLSNGLPSNPRQFTPLPGLQGENYTRLSFPQQQQQQQPIMNQHDAQSGPPQGQFFQSGETTRTNTWLQTSDEGYLPSPVDANGFPVDTKGKRRDGDDPFTDPPKGLAASKTAVTVTDLEKQDLEKHDHDEKHGHWE